MTIFNLFQLCCIILLLFINIYYCKIYIYINKEIKHDKTEKVLTCILVVLIHLFPLMLLFGTIGWFNDSMNIVINPKQYWDAFINFKII